jgi:hypothetical protein
MTTHTASPWKWSGFIEKNVCIGGLYPERDGATVGSPEFDDATRPIAKAFLQSSGNGHAAYLSIRPEDAPLIAAAPEMYEFLRELRRSAEQNDPPDIRFDIDALDAILTKAETPVNIDSLPFLEATTTAPVVSVGYAWGKAEETP